MGTQLIKQLKNDKIRINQNSNPIPMDLFLSFFIVPVEKYEGDYLGKSTGWTKYVNESINLEIKGGICDGGHWLHSIEYGKNLQNGFNNFVNPFYLFPLFNEHGVKFFLNYYKSDIDAVIEKQKQDIKYHKKKYEEENQKHSEMLMELQELINQSGESL